MIEALLDRVENLDGFWDDLGDWWAKRQTDWFASGNIPINAPSTTRRKGSAQGLVDTGALRDSTRLNQPFNRSLGSATFGLRKGTPSYLKAVLGLAEPRGAPRRAAVAPIGSADIHEVRTILTDYIMDAAEGMF
jgi:hypothetical protein